MYICIYDAAAVKPRAPLEHVPYKSALENVEISETCTYI